MYVEQEIIGKTVYGKYLWRWIVLCKPFILKVIKTN